MIPERKQIFPVEPNRSRLLGELWQIQLSEKHISDEAIRQLALQHSISEIEVEGVVSFYHFFHRTPTGKHTIYLNNSIVSETKGYNEIKEAFEREAGVRMGSVDPTGTFGLFSTPCIGLSDQEPAALIDFYPFVNLTEQKVRDIIRKLASGIPASELADEPSDNIRFVPDQDKALLLAPYTPGQSVEKLAEMSPERILEMIEKAGIRGRGGAFFPTWLKWDACRKQPATPKFVVCNADEGEPGTFKDRVLLNGQTGSLLEGMIIAGYTVGATYGIIYLRGEYRWLVQKIEAEIEAFRNKGLLGVNAAGIRGFKFDIRLEIGAGAYVCGEETALLESLEGKRGEPRTKWFFPAERGYLQLPTIVNNVETFCIVSRLIEKGLPEYLRRGIPGSPGTKLISVSGDCKLPGIYEIEWGMSIAELLDRCEADDPNFIQVSGPSGKTLSAKEKNWLICMPSSGIPESIACGGSFMTFNKKNDLLDILLNFSEFFKHESCGVCTPCRAGNFIIQRKLSQLIHGTGTRTDLAELKKWAVIMEAASRCGLGKTAGNAVIDTIERFGDYFDAKLPEDDKTGIRNFDMESAVAEYEKFNPKA